MLEHLDDPRPFRPDDEFRAGVRSRGRWLRARRAVAGGMTAVLFLGGAAGAGALYVDRRDAAIDRVEVVTTPSVDGATNILLVGTDEAVDLADPSTPPSGRADTMAVVRIEADGSVRVLSLPRDLWVPDKGARLNESLAGGPQQLVTDITETTGIPVDHYVQLDFRGFIGLVDEVGGIRVRIHDRARDATTGIYLEPSPACAALDGAAALALLRSRHLEVEGFGGDPGWTTDPSGDLGRIERGRVVMKAVLASLGAQDPGMSDPVAVDRLSRILADHAVLDSALTLTRMAELGAALVDADPTAFVGETVPVADANMDGAQVLVATADAPAVYTRFGAPTVEAAPGRPAAGPTAGDPDEGFVPVGPCDPS